MRPASGPACGGLPDDPDEPVPGILRYDAEGGRLLLLWSRFGNDLIGESKLPMLELNLLV